MHKNISSFCIIGPETKGPCRQESALELLVVRNYIYASMNGIPVAEEDVFFDMNSGNTQSKGHDFLTMDCNACQKGNCNNACPATGKNQGIGLRIGEGNFCLEPISIVSTRMPQ